MKEEQIAWKKKHLDEKRVSMKRRDDHHDYAERRMYMITIEVEGRRPIFGHLEGDVFASSDSANAPHIVLSPLGRMVQNEWLGIPRYYPQIEVKGIQMMPDHFHGILFVKDRLPVHLGLVISGFKAGCRKALRMAATGGITVAEPLPTVKTNPLTTEMNSQQVAAVPSSNQPLFTLGYNDLILRSYDELSTWLNYLRDNPRRLMMKRKNPEFLRPFFDLQVGPYTFSGVGNRGLLEAPRRIPVRISRRLIGNSLEQNIEHYLNEVRQGAVLVSPSISPGEKLTMRQAFNAGFPTIVIMENGFTPLSKPHGEQFYACAEGRLLMLSAWEHHNNKQKLTADMCRQMNLMALAICGIK